MLLKQLQQLKAGTRAKDAEIAKLKAILAESEPKYEEYQRILKETEEKSETAKKLQIDITACEAELSSLSPTAGTVSNEFVSVLAPSPNTSLQEASSLTN